MKQRTKIRRVAFDGVLCCLALILAYVELLIPMPFPVPGIKLGLPNLCIVILLFAVSEKDALAVNVGRVVLSALLFSNLSMMIYSLAGAVFSFIVMVLIRKLGKNGIVGTSIAGAAAHNVAQIAVASLATKTFRVFYYLPALIISAVITGFAIGYASALLIPKLQLLLKTGPESAAD